MNQSSTDSREVAVSSQLERTRRQLEQVQQLARLGSWEFDIPANTVTWTDGLYDIYGQSRADFPATYEGYLACVHPDDRDRVARTITAAMELGGSFEFEERIVRPSGDVRTLLSVGRVIRDDAGTPLQLVGVCRDITDEKTAQDILERRERQLAAAQKIARLGSWEFEIATNSITWSDELYRIWGVDPATFVLSYETYAASIHPDDAAMVQANVGRCMAEGVPFEHEHRLVRPDGEVRIVLGRGEAQRDVHGTIVRLAGTAQDITEQKRAEQQAQQLIREQAARAEVEIASKRLQFIAEASRILASSLDYEQTLLNVARLAVPSIADWCAVDIVTENGLQRLAVEHIDPSKISFALEIETRYPSDPDATTGVANVLRTGEPEWVAEIPDEMLEAAAVDAEHLRLIRELGLRSYICVPLIVDGKTIGAMTFVHAESARHFTDSDLTLLLSVGRRAAIAIHNSRLVRELMDAYTDVESQREELEAQSLELEAQAAELEEAMSELEHRNQELDAQREEAVTARQAAEQANAAKSQFLANMSHELRTPLNAIGGYSQLLELGVHGPVTEAQLGVIERIRSNQTRLLALINDLLNFVKLRAGRLEISLAPMRVAELLAGVNVIVEPLTSKKDILLSIESPSADVFMLANQERAEQVLLNLVTNAIKFTDTGGRVDVKAEVQDNRVLVHVTDTGLGIPEDKLEEIFEPFIQITQHRVRDNQGVGLGLAISRDLMTEMGGSLTVVSRVGVGSQFTISFARATPASSAELSQPAATLSAS